MKKQMLLGLVALLITTASFGQSEVENEIGKVIEVFAQSGDDQDVDDLDAILDENYRIVMNRLFGSTTVSVMNKEQYLEKIRIKEYGGDNRTVSIESVLINGTTATAKVTLKGDKMTFVSLLSLIQNSDGKWKLLSDIPIVE